MTIEDLISKYGTDRISLLLLSLYNQLPEKNRENIERDFIEQIAADLENALKNWVAYTSD